MSITSTTFSLFIMDESFISIKSFSIYRNYIYSPIYPGIYEHFSLIYKNQISCVIIFYDQIANSYKTANIMDLHSSPDYFSSKLSQILIVLREQIDATNDLHRKEVQDLRDIITIKDNEILLLKKQLSEKQKEPLKKIITSNKIIQRTVNNTKSGKKIANFNTQNIPVNAKIAQSILFESNSSKVIKEPLKIVSQNSSKKILTSNSSMKKLNSTCFSNVSLTNSISKKNQLTNSTISNKKSPSMEKTIQLSGKSASKLERSTKKTSVNLKLKSSSKKSDSKQNEPPEKEEKSANFCAYGLKPLKKSLI